jgi:hypothetical protein
MAEPLSDLYPTPVSGQESNGIDPLKGQMALVREDPRVVKSSWGMNSAQESKAISQTERNVFLSEEEKKITIRRERMAS